MPAVTPSEVGGYTGLRVAVVHGCPIVWRYQEWKSMWALGRGLWAMGRGLWALGYELRAARL